MAFQLEGSRLGLDAAPASGLSRPAASPKRAASAAVAVAYIRSSSLGQPLWSYFATDKDRLYYGFCAVMERKVGPSDTSLPAASVRLHRHKGVAHGQNQPLLNLLQPLAGAF